MKLLLKWILGIVVFFGVGMGLLIWASMPVTLPPCGDPDTEEGLIEDLTEFHLEMVDHKIIDRKARLLSPGVELSYSGAQRVCECEVELEFPSTGKPTERKRLRYELERANDDMSYSAVWQE